MFCITVLYNCPTLYKTESLTKAVVGLLTAKNNALFNNPPRVSAMTNLVCVCVVDISHYNLFNFINWSGSYHIISIVCNLVNWIYTTQLIHYSACEHVRWSTSYVRFSDILMLSKCLTLFKIQNGMNVAGSCCHAFMWRNYFAMTW